MKKILIVDDNPQNLYLLEIMLLSNGFLVQKAANGSEGLEYARKDPPDMVISDILMPTMDGFSFCRACKTDEKLKKIPFIFYTATYTDTKDEAFALNLGAEKFLVKPLEPTDMLKAIQEVFTKKEFGELKTPEKSMDSQEEYYKTYSETLVRKLEDKMMQLERAKNRLAALYRASCELILHKQSGEMIKSVMHAIVETAGFQKADYFEYDDEHKKLFFTKSMGFSQEADELVKDRLTFNLGEKKGLVGIVAQNGLLINIRDTLHDPRWIVIDPVIQSALFVPVKFESTLLGVIGLFSKELDAFTTVDEQNVSSLANGLAIAIINQKNEKRIQSQLSRLSVLHSIDRAINGNMELREILNTIMKFIFEQMDVDAGGIIIFNRYTFGYELVSGNGFITHAADTRDLHQRYELAEKVILEHRLVHIGTGNENEIPEGYRSLWAREGFKEYWGTPLFARGDVNGVLEIFKRTSYTPESDWLAYLETLAGQIAIAIESSEMVEGLKKSNVDLRMAYDATIEGWSRALDMRDHETEDHTLRVVDATLILASAMGINNDDLIHIKRGALLHDIGKMAVPDEILHKPGPLTEAEWVIMRKHPQFAYELLSPIGYLHRALDIPSCHHEKWDGTGYPRGLKGEQIPLAARLFAVVDVWDALRSDRPYRKAWPDEKVVQYIQEQSGSHFDPHVVQVFLSVLADKS